MNRGTVQVCPRRAALCFRGSLRGSVYRRCGDDDPFSDFRRRMASRPHKFRQGQSVVPMDIDRHFLVAVSIGPRGCVRGAAAGIKQTASLRIAAGKLSALSVLRFLESHGVAVRCAAIGSSPVVDPMSNLGVLHAPSSSHCRTPCTAATASQFHRCPPLLFECGVPMYGNSFRMSVWGLRPVGGH